MTRTFTASGGVLTASGGVYVAGGGGNDPPAASFSHSPSEPAASETVNFDGSGSSDPDGTIESYEWDFTNDGTIDATGSTASHVYGAAGSYTAALTVTDDDGATDTATQTVTVPPIEDFEASDPISTYRGDTGQFSVVTTNVYSGSQALETSSTASDDIIIYDGTGPTPVQDQSYQHVIDAPDGIYPGHLFFVQSGSTGWNDWSGYDVEYETQNNRINLVRADSGSLTALARTSLSTLVTNEYVIMQYQAHSSGVIDVEALTQSGTSLATISYDTSNDATQYTSGSFGWKAQGDTIHFDQLIAI
jgi:PKD repeat protein